jgi:hypothetical protein
MLRGVNSACLLPVFAIFLSGCGGRGGRGLNRRLHNRILRLAFISGAQGSSSAPVSRFP